MYKRRYGFKNLNLSLWPLCRGVYEKKMSYYGDTFAGRTNDTGTSAFCAVQANNFK